VSQDKYFFKAYNYKKVLPVHALIVFTVFGFLVDEKIKLKVLASSFEILANVENPSNIPLRRP
jgi:hypothetical protein